MDPSAYGQAWNAFNTLLKIMMIALCIAVPLALWKIIELAIWLFNNVTIGVK